MTYRKIGGIHWLAIGRLRLSWCVVRKAPVGKRCRKPLIAIMPHVKNGPFAP